MAKKTNIVEKEKSNSSPQQPVSSNIDVKVEMIDKNNLETIDLKDLYTYFSFTNDMIKDIATDYQLAYKPDEEEIKNKYNNFLNIKFKIKTELTRRLMNLMNENN